MAGYVIEYHRPSGAHRVHEFPGVDGHREAMRFRLQLEAQRKDLDIEIVSINSTSLENLKRTHSRYFSVGSELQSA